jgi:hypothetical protein
MRGVYLVREERNGRAAWRLTPRVRLRFLPRGELIIIFCDRSLGNSRIVADVSGRIGP